MAGNLIALRDAREQIIARLSDHFAHDELDLDEFDRRVTQAHRAESPAELEALVAGLPDRGAASTPAAPTDAKPTAAIAKPEAAPGTAIVPASQVRPAQTLVAIMGGV